MRDPSWRTGSCSVNKTYKDSILEYLLDKSAYGRGRDMWSYSIIKGSSSFFPFSFTTPNSHLYFTGCKDTNSHAPKKPSSDPAAAERPQFVCPLTLKEMNSVQPFIYLLPCSCVFSQAGLKTIAGTSSPKEDEEQESGKELEANVCKQI
jgi:Rtf2 RING-finger